MMRHMVAAILRHGGYTVAEAGDGREAALKLAREHFDLLITDVFMPERDGLETLKNLKNEQSGLPVIAMSGMLSASPFYLSIAESLGAKRTLEKPFTAAQLLQATREVLEEAKAEQSPSDESAPAASRPLHSTRDDRF
jgi:CheY-like chemotaxis protein